MFQEATDNRVYFDDITRRVNEASVFDVVYNAALMSPNGRLIRRFGKMDSVARSK